MSGETATLLKFGRELLAMSGIADPARDARLLLQEASGLTAEQIIAAADIEDVATVRGRYSELLALRAGGKPVSRIIGRREFHGLQFRVTADVLDPRPETELLVDMAHKDHRTLGTLRFLDIGTGSGAIAVTLLVLLPHARVMASDISSAALEVAQANADSNSVSARFEPVLSDGFAAISGQFDFIVSNPPYISTNEIPELAGEVRSHDPMIALDGGADGLDFYRLILAEAQGYLKDSGRLYLEIGSSQCEAVSDIAKRNRWREIAVHHDLAGLPRMVTMAK